jgi:SAM-dependent methyltransferase
MDAVTIERPAAALSALRDCADILQCPVTGETLVAVEDGWTSAGGARRYSIDHGIANLCAALDPRMPDHASARMGKAFPEDTPPAACEGPDYAGIESREILVAKARQSQFVEILDRQLPNRAIVLDAGCGTGRLTNFLGLSWDRRVFGGDICLDALRLANGLRERFRIANAAFLRMDLFRPPFRDDSLDIVIANSVLDHTADARKRFEALLCKVKPGGCILIGGYNSYGRLPSLWRRWASERFAPALDFVDGRLNSGRQNQGGRQARLRDQRRGPRETRHSIDEILAWFDAAEVDFLSSIPAADGSPLTNSTPLFEPSSRGSRTVRAAAQLQTLLTGGREGGVFIMIGRKRR